MAKGTFAFSLLVEALERERGQALGNQFRCRSGACKHLPSLRDIGIGRRQAFGHRFRCSCLEHSIPQTLEMRRGQAFRNSFRCHAQVVCTCLPEAEELERHHSFGNHCNSSSQRSQPPAKRHRNRHRRIILQAMVGLMLVAKAFTHKKENPFSGLRK